MTTASDKGALFDLDGVLVNTGLYHLQSWHALARQQGWGHYTDEFFYETFGMQNARIIPMIVGRPLDEKTISALSDEKERLYRELIAGNLQLLPGVVDLLTDLRRHDFKIAIGTSTPPLNLEFMLDTTNSRAYFDAFVTSADVKKGKPDPDTFLQAAAAVNLPPNRCVVIEDALQGVQAGKAADAMVLAVTTTRARADLAQAGADLIVDSLADVSAADFIRLIETRRSFSLATDEA